jgi:diguanylate cyclase (GGDEF)-like protein
MGRLGLTAVFLIAVALLSLRPAPAAAGPATLHASGHAAFVIAPPGARLMNVTIGGRTSTAGTVMPIGSSRLGHAVPSIAVPASVPAGTPIVVQVFPADAGAPRLLADDEVIDRAVVDARVSGIVLGILFAFLLLQIGAYLVTRDPSIPFFVGSIVTMGLIELQRDNVISFGTLLPPLVGLVFLDLVSGVCDLAFALTYLRLWRDDRSLFWTLLLGAIPPAVVAVLTIVVPGLHPVAEAIRAPTLCVGMLVLLGVTIARMRAFPPARYLLAALFVLALSLVYRVVRDATPIAVPLFDRWFFEVSAVCNVLVFGLAVVMRSRYLLRERRALESQLDEATYAAEHDALTGALNRRGLVRTTAGVRGGTLFFLDLDEFKTVNDRYGHAVGDEVLGEVVGAIRGVVGSMASIARVGGDEFVVVVTHDERGEIDRLSERIVEAIASVPARSVQLGVSIGYAPLSGLTLDNAMRIADAQAYRTKKSRHPAPHSA